MGTFRRKGNRAFGAHQRGQKAGLQTVQFLGQQFIVAGRRGKTYDLVGPEGTDLAGILIRNVSSDALKRYRNDDSARTQFL